MKIMKSGYVLEQEYSQAKVRLVLVLGVLFYFTIINYQEKAVWIASGYWVYSLLVMYHIKKTQKASVLRRTFNIIGDIGAIALAMRYSDSNAVIMYPALLWIIIGNGMRFGVKSLLVSLAVAEIAYAYVLVSSSYWLTQKGVVYSLIIGVAAISLFYILLVKKLHDANDILEEKVAQRAAKIEYMYLHDSLTGLKNRAALIAELQKSKYAGLILIDIDNFHNYNELYGMKIGNDVLKGVASWLKQSSLGKRYEVYRIHADRFILRSRDANIDPDTIEKDIKELIGLFKNLKITIETLDEVLDIDATIGSALGDEQVLKMVEMALKHAKTTRKQYIIYSDHIDDTSYSQELLIWKKKIKEALEHNNIVPVYQAIVNSDNEILKYESLMRLRELHEDKEKLISPFFFLDIAIKSKIYPRLTLAMIEKTFRDMKKNGNKFSINLTFDDMINSYIVDALRSQIKKYDIGKQITFEIVESENIDDFAYAKKFVQEFKELGVEVAIDDFGTGYSNFTHILELEPDYLKIDGSLIKNIAHDQKSYELVKSIVTFSKSLGIQTIAEFVASKEIFDICRDLGVDHFQGYYFSEPLVYNALQEYELKRRSDELISVS
ncbi:MAG: GGDEF domain-containing response regulator [Sulfurospirillum sp.]|nr:MAG: GGDEF domain-containing response regulator [Sulfurospirillum sp.]